MSACVLKLANVYSVVGMCAAMISIFTIQSVCLFVQISKYTAYSMSVFAAISWYSVCVSVYLAVWLTIAAKEQKLKKKKVARDTEEGPLLVAQLKEHQQQAKAAKAAKKLQHKVCQYW